jgi:SAM-dependent methyltransferase
VVDKLFSLPELARLYDPLDPDRRDLTAYVDLLGELGARSVLDIGCGTGTFALMLAQRGADVIGVDPAKASLDVARSKPGAERVHWVQADAIRLPPCAVDAVTMTGNVAQVFLDDEEWSTVLQSVRRTLRPGGHLVFETRDPQAQAWRGWTHECTTRTAHVEGVGDVLCWEEVTDVDGPTVSFQTTFSFPDESLISSTSTLRFRSRDEVLADLNDARFGPTEVRGAPDRPGLEFVFIARRPSDSVPG